MTKNLIPTVEDLAADVQTHHYDDMVAPPGLTNFLGTVRVDHDLTSLSAVTFPPVSQGLASTGILFVDNRVFESYGIPVSHAWRPDRVVRTANLPGLVLETVTVCVPGEMAVTIDIRVTNTGEQLRTVPVTLAVNARVSNTGEAWLDAELPSERNGVTQSSRRLSFSSSNGAAWNVQGVDVDADVRLSGVAISSTEEFEAGIGGVGRGGEISVTLEIPAGETRRFGYVNTVGTSGEQANATFDKITSAVPQSISSSEEFWNSQLEAVFTPNNLEYSGNLPILETESDALRKLYWWGALGVIWFRREFKGNVLGRTYDTLMPNYWATTTFMWDFSLSSISHALLDPDPMRKQLTHWISNDIHTMFGTSSLTGGPVGRWYSVNDYAMTRLVNDYVRFTGNIEFLEEEPEGMVGNVAEHLRSWALAWRDLRTSSPLADYGEIDNLLECVSSYTHEVASLNAANVWSMRTAAAVASLRSDDAGAQELTVAAEELLPSVIDLYVKDKGYFNAQQPDGSKLPVRHCYDFNIVGTTIANDLDVEMRKEMVSFFQEELQSPSWLRALSPWDPDASFSVRPDHQWNGAYPAWPADAARALVALGAPNVALEWLEGLSRTANQGPPGQAHFVEEAQPTINGGARKAPPQLPYINDWACSSSGSWVALVIQSLFGVEPNLDGTVIVQGCVAELDPTAVLRGLRVGEKFYDVHADGKIVEIL